MKTLDKIIKEHKKFLINNGIADWNEKDTKLVAITFASQAIDRCAELAVYIDQWGNELEVDTQSILNVKSELK